MPTKQTDDVSKLKTQTGIDLSDMPQIMTPEQLAAIMGQSVAALANDRWRRIGVPYVKYGKRVRYLRADVARYLIKQHRNSALADA
jgi:hypothetical protein